MRLIERLLQRAENRPKPDLLGVVCPWGDKWYFALHSYKKGKCEQPERMAFDFKADALQYAESVMKNRGKILSVNFIDKDKRDAPFTTAEKEAAASANH